MSFLYAKYGRAVIAGEVAVLGGTYYIYHNLTMDSAYRSDLAHDGSYHKIGRHMRYAAMSALATLPHAVIAAPIHHSNKITYLLIQGSHGGQDAVVYGQLFS